MRQHSQDDQGFMVANEAGFLGKRFKHLNVHVNLTAIMCEFLWERQQT